MNIIILFALDEEKNQYDLDNMSAAMYLANGTELYYENDVYNYRVRNTIVNNSNNFYFSARG